MAKIKQKNNGINSAVRKAKTLINKGDYDKALEIYSQLIEENPADADAWCNLGLLYYHKGEIEEAEQAFLKCIEYDPEVLEAYFNLGRLYQSNREFEKALTYYKEVVTRNEEDGIAYYYMGQCAKAVGRIDDAVAFLDEAIRLQPNNLEVGVALATLYVERGDYQKAEDALRVILVSHADVVPVHFSLGLILREQGKKESALAQFSRVVQLDENHVQGFYNLAECCMDLGLLDQAEPFYAKACKLDPDFDQPVIKLGDLYRKQGKDNDAVIMYRHWIDMKSPYIKNFQEEELKEYINVCDILAEHFTQQGNKAEASDYLNKKAELTKANFGQEHDYRVSLKIDE